MPPLSPWPIYAIISGVGAGVTVTAKNGTTSETQTAVTVADSSVIIDSANFTSGYADGDEITISLTGRLDMVATIDLSEYPDGIGIYISKPSAYDAFNWPYTITKSIVIPGYTSQSDGSWVPESSSDMLIRGFVSDISIKELQRLEPGRFSAGGRKVTLDKNIGLKVGDYIKITENSAGTDITEWFVVARQSTSILLDSLRDTFLLARQT